MPLVAGAGLPERMRASLAGQLDRAWEHIAATVGDDGYLLGGHVTLADMQMVYVTAVASATGMLAAQPAVEAYHERLLAHPALRRAIEAGGPMA